MSEDRRYTSLMNNTVIFAISTISSKLIVFLLMPLYTRLLTPADYAVMDIIVQTSNFLTPLVFISINEAVIRYALDKSVKKSDVFSTGINTCLKGFLLFALTIPILGFYDTIADFTVLIYIYVVSSCLRGVCSQFTRGIGLVRLYAFDSVLATISIIVFNIIFMVVLKLGVTGYILSVIFSNFFSVFFLEITAKLHRFYKPGGISSRVRRQMVKYSLPLIPTTLFWWVINVSDRYIVNFFEGESVTGIYSVAYKIPTIIFLISSIFTQAWQLSAVNEYDQKGKDKFYSRIFTLLMSAVFTTASLIILLIRPFTMILVEKSYYPSWEIAPVLVVALVFSCFATFFSSFYMASKQNTMSFVTTLVGALINVALNFSLIPIMGVMGAAVATLLSYFVVFIFRAIDTRRFVKLSVPVHIIALNTVAVLMQAVASSLDVSYNPLVQILLTAFVVMLNLKSLLFAIITIYDTLSKRFKKARG